MSESKLRTQSMDFAVQIINLVKALKEKENIHFILAVKREGKG
ncbi:MAG: hypothetical protein SPJ77_06550 [Eubacteriales bacterium]|nr:hypothetical protein [Eubacteriales bacterium]